MALHAGVLALDTRGEGHIVDLTEGVASVVRTAGVQHASVSVFVGGSTAAVTTMEFEPGGVQDLGEALERLLPRERPGAEDYAHNRRNADDNAHAHLRASLVGPSVTLPLIGGRLALGTWQQVVLIDFDDRPRRREVHVQVVS